jgi:hypothetical protein
MNNPTRDRRWRFVNVRPGDLFAYLPEEETEEEQHTDNHNA